MLPLCHPFLQLREEEVVVQLINGLDIGEHVKDDVWREHVVGAVLVVHAELEFLKRARHW